MIMLGQLDACSHRDVVLEKCRRAGSGQRILGRNRDVAVVVSAAQGDFFGDLVFNPDLERPDIIPPEGLHDAIDDATRAAEA